MTGGEPTPSAAVLFIQKHKGVLSWMKDDVPGLKGAGISEVAISGPTLARRLAAMDGGLSEECDRQRRLHGICGRKSHLDRGSIDVAAETTAIREALAKHGWKPNETSAELGIARRTLYRRMEALGIRKREVKPEVARRRLLKQLAMHGYNVKATAATLGVSHTTVQDRMDALGIDRAEMRKRKARATFDRRLARIEEAIAKGAKSTDT